ncbi:MAG: hypothetical protein C4521_00055 [Actinobacteria bacterium]|nr:MAG: hypothetical protein C4521_00055 [Actinomycetota bacterium]
MFDFELWQWVIVAAVGAASVAWMGWTIARLFSRRSRVRGSVREASAFESGIADAERPIDADAFDVWSYRVGARFAGRVRIVISSETVSVAGPRVPRGLYRAWIWAQGMLLALAVPALASAVVKLDWRWLVLALGLAAVSWAVSSTGAGLWPGLGEIEVVDHGRFSAVEFPREAISSVKIGAGWSDGGLALVLWPYKKGIDKLARNRAVSFFAPDGEGLLVRYALHAYSEEDAARLAGRLPTQAGGAL